MKPLHNTANQALRWIEANIAYFDPFRSGNQPDDFISKTLLELVCILMYAARDGNSLGPIESRADSLAMNVWRRPEFWHRLPRNPEKLRLYAMIYIALKRKHLIGDEYDEVVDRVLRDDYITSIEQLPFRQLDTWHTLRLCGIQASSIVPEEVLRQSTLSAPMSVFRVTELDAYCITHELFYITDFAAEPPPAFLVTRKAEITWTLNKLLGRFLCAANWDLVAELLLASACLGVQPQNSSWYWTALCDAQLENGAIPGPEFNHEECVSHLDPALYEFEKNYHTTLVTLLAIAIIHPWGKRANV